MKEREYLDYDGSWNRGGLDLSTGTGLFNIRVVQHIITPCRLRHHIRLGFRYHALHAVGLSMIMSLLNICE